MKGSYDLCSDERRSGHSKRGFDIEVCREAAGQNVSGHTTMTRFITYGSLVIF